MQTKLANAAMDSPTAGRMIVKGMTACSGAEFEYRFLPVCLLVSRRRTFRIVIAFLERHLADKWNEIVAIQFDTKSGLFS
jgi:hypothetical protein